MIAAPLSPAPQGVLERAAEESRAGRYVEAWEIAAAAPEMLERAQACSWVRYHAGDLDGALAEAVRGLERAPQDPLLLATSTEIALSLHRGAAAEPFLARWRRAAAPADAARLEQAAGELAELRAAETGAGRGVSRAHWISALAGALALAFLLRCALQKR